MLPLIPQARYDVSAHKFEQRILRVTCIDKIVNYISLPALVYLFIDYLSSSVYCLLVKSHESVTSTSFL